MPTTWYLDTPRKWWSFVRGMNDFYTGLDTAATDDNLIGFFSISDPFRSAGFKYAMKLSRLASAA